MTRLLRRQPQLCKFKLPEQAASRHVGLVCTRAVCIATFRLCLFLACVHVLEIFRVVCIEHIQNGHQQQDTCSILSLTHFSCLFLFHLVFFGHLHRGGVNSSSPLSPYIVSDCHAIGHMTANCNCSSGHNVYEHPGHFMCVFNSVPSRSQYRTPYYHSFHPITAVCTICIAYRAQSMHISLFALTVVVVGSGHNYSASGVDAGQLQHCNICLECAALCQLSIWLSREGLPALY